jgi:hypothetical protein
MMNRRLAWAAGLFLLLIASVYIVYIVIPSRLEVTKIVLLNCNRDGADRVLGDTASWFKWWPHTGSGIRYKMSERLHRGTVIVIDDRGSAISSVLNIFPLTRVDSSYLQWQFIREASWNPLTRIGQYRQAVRLKVDMAVILDSFGKYLDDPINIYGLAITQASTQDSFLVETRRTMKYYPGTDAIYDLVKRLEFFVAKRGGVRTGCPMVNVDTLAAGQFMLRTAIPINKECGDSGDIVARKLIKGNYLESDVRGGPVALREALQHMKDYIADNKRTVMAIPFFSLITDRTRERDTANWVTRIYYPIY